MINKARRFSVKPTTLEGIQTDQDMTWCLCNGYSLHIDGDMFLILNDSFTEDSLQEYAICRVLQVLADGYLIEQLESLTLSWVEKERVPAKILECCKETQFVSKPFAIHADDYTKHHCYHCA